MIRGRIAATGLLLGLTLLAFAHVDTFAFQRARNAGRPQPKNARGAKPKSKPQELAPLPGSKKPKKAESDDPESPDERGKIADLKADGDLPRLQEMKVPTVEQLQKSPVDWVVLKGPNKTNELVIAVKPVFPRPDTLTKLQTSLDALRKQPRPTLLEEREKLNAQKNELQNLAVTLPDDAEGQIYEIPTNVIDHIVYHEDLIVRRAGLLIEKKQFRDAFELLYALARQPTPWKGVEEQMQHLLLIEADDAAAKGDLETAFTSLEELDGRNRQYPGLQTKLGTAVDQLIARARQENNVREARHFLARLARIEPKQETVAKWTNQLLEETRKLMDAASQAYEQGRHEEAVTLIDEAARVWPAAPGLKDAHRRFNNRYQRLRVGLLTLSSDSPQLPFTSLSKERETRLLRFNLFDVDGVDDATHYRSRLLEQWEPTDLGRRVRFVLRNTRSRWESRPILTANTVLSTIESLLDPHSPGYDERLASYIESVRLRSPFEFEVQFVRVPPRTEPLFRFPIRAPAGAKLPIAGTADRESPADSDGQKADGTISALLAGAPGTALFLAAGQKPSAAARSSASSQGLEPIVSRRFDKVRETDRLAVYRRAFPQPDGLSDYQVAEIEEQKYDTPERAIQALYRGDVSLLADLPTWALPTLREDPRFFILDYAIPTTHVLQFNPQSEPCKSRELRLALAFSIDSRRILSRVVLRDSSVARGRVVTAPYATTSYAYNPLVPAREFNPYVAASLADAAGKRLKGVPVLRLVCDPQLSARSAAAEMIEQWKRVGIRVELVAAGESTKWDMAYRTLRMSEPLVELAPFLTVDVSARLESERHLTDWLRHELLGLENAPSWKSAVSRLQQLQGQLYAEVEYIPLWEVDDSLVLRKNVHGFPPPKWVTSYQGIERWVIQPWYPEDSP